MELHFFGPAGGLDRFPKEYELRTRCNAATAAPLDPFVLSTSYAIERVWILDLHFDHVGVAALEIGLKGSSVRDVRLLTGTRKDDLKPLTARLNAVRLPANTPAAAQTPQLASVEWRDFLDSKSYPFPHDRFALVDGELWHFGHTVGGAGKCLFACSGPWDAQATEAIDFYEGLWQKFGPARR